MLQTVRYSFEDQLHVLRHFNEVGKEYRQMLKEANEISDFEIDSLLSVYGSKFYPDFINNPLELWESVLSHENIHSYVPLRWEGLRSVIILKFDNTKFPGGIGSDSLICLDHISEGERRSVYQDKRDGFLVNFVPLIRKTPSWQLNVVLWNDPEVFVKSIFPGIYAPPFPDIMNQQENEYLENKHFWEKHAFIQNS